RPFEDVGGRAGEAAGAPERVVAADGAAEPERAVRPLARAGAPEDGAGPFAAEQREPARAVAAGEPQAAGRELPRRNHVEPRRADARLGRAGGGAARRGVAPGVREVQVAGE